MRSNDVTRPSMVAWLGYDGLLAHCRQDLLLSRALLLPDWYLPLRLQLTLIASLCLASIYFFGPVPVSQGITV